MQCELDGFDVRWRGHFFLLGLSENQSQSDSELELAKLHCPSSQQDTWGPGLSAKCHRHHHMHIVGQLKIRNTTKKLFKIPHTNRCSGSRWKRNWSRNRNWNWKWVTTVQGRCRSWKPKRKRTEMCGVGLFEEAPPPFNALLKKSLLLICNYIKCIAYYLS